MICIIYPNVDIWNYMLQDCSNSYIKVFPLNNCCTIVQIVFRKIFPYFEVPLYFLFGKQMRNSLQRLGDGDSILICDYNDLCLFKSISKSLNKRVKKSFWLWNPIPRYSRFDEFKIKIQSIGFSIYTFDPHDSNKYNIRLCNQFMRMHIGNSNEMISTCEWDFYFLGSDKNRKDEILNIKRDLSRFKLNFKVVENKSDIIKYSDNVKNVMLSKCIVEITQQHQAGMTLRALEALTYNKKLLTNNKWIRAADFYNPNNIFIIGEDNIEDIDTFMHLPYVSVSEDIRMEYSVEAWISNFL